MSRDRTSVPVAIFALLVGHASLSVAADDRKPVDGGARAAQLDVLFMRLRDADSEAEGRAIEDAIWQHWTQSGDPRFDGPMREVFAARGRYDFDRALALLDGLGAAYPDNAEVWNQRATVYFQRGDLESSLEAIAETLLREPRHFGALAGRATIRLQQGRSALAIQNVRRAVEIHPFLKERHWLQAAPVVR